MSDSLHHDRNALPPVRGGTPVRGEGALLEWVRRRQAEQLARMPNPAVLVPAGDDLAVLQWSGGLLLLGLDPVLDGVHFDLSRHTPAAAGRKAINRNLSDVAAMGGEPVAAVLSLIAPRSMPLAEVQNVYLGAEQAANAVGCPIVGGDFATWEGRLVVTVGILGRAETPVSRSGARAGQRIFVTGALGGSILGRHLTFLPRLELGQRIARDFRATAMIDLSDGLSVDLPRLLGKQLGATIDAAAVPIHLDAVDLARETGREPLWHALNDGEDYELLFTAGDEALPGCIAIGRIDAEPLVRLRRGSHVQLLPPEGWEHAVSS